MDSIRVCLLLPPPPPPPSSSASSPPRLQWIACSGHCRTSTGKRQIAVGTTGPQTQVADRCGHYNLKHTMTNPTTNTQPQIHDHGNMLLTMASKQIVLVGITRSKAILPMIPRNANTQMKRAWFLKICLRLYTFTSTSISLPKPWQHHPHPTSSILRTLGCPSPSPSTPTSRLRQ